MEATASYDYSAFEPDQLSFKEGDVIKILAEVNSDWFDAELHGRFGVVPGNYISFTYPAWYEVLSKESAVSLLLGRGPQATNFLVRPSEATPGEMSLSVKMGDVQHFKILRDQNGKYYIWNDDPHFSSINKLLTHYKKHSVSRADHMLLREEGESGGGGGGRGGGRGVSGGFARASKAVKETVTAMYDFQSRNDEELTIYKGDVITLLETVDSSWLRGSIRRNGVLEQGLFPADYV